MKSGVGCSSGRGEAVDLHHAVAAEPELRMAGRQHLHGRERVASEALLIRGDRTHGALREMDLAPLEHCEQLWPRGVHQPHLHAGIARRVVAQEIGKNAFDQVRRGRHTQHTDVAAPQDLRLLAHGAGVVEQSAAVVEQLLAFAREERPPPTRSKSLSPMALEIGDLAGKAPAARRAGRRGPGGTVPTRPTVTKVRTWRRS